MQRDKLSVITLNAAKKYTDSHGGGGGGGTTNYNDLSHKPSINSTTLEGNLTLANLGIQAAEDGKGLSDNNYSDTDKGIVNGVTSALAGKVDKVNGKGLSTNDYSDADKTIVGGVTSALAGKVDKVSGKGLSTNDYDDTAKGIVDGVTSALGNKADASTVNAILNGSTIDSFADVETALADKVDKVSGKGLSTNDYDATAKGKLDGLANVKSIGSGLNLNTSTGELTATGASITIDSEMSDSSTNPVQNKVITAALGNKADTSSLGTASSKNVAASGNASSTEVVMGNDTRLTDARNAADVSAWAKASTKPTYTATEVGAIASTEKGANSGVATLDSSGKVPTSQLPSYVDDVLEYNSQSAFPATGESGKIYIAKDTNKTYRWSGTAYVEISPSLALGETSSTAYAGNKGKANADNISAIQGLIPSSATTSNKLATASDIPSLTNYVQKSSTAGLLKNDGTVDTTSYKAASAHDSWSEVTSKPFNTIGDSLTTSSNALKVNTAFTEASTRANIATGETIPTVLGKIKKYFTDLKTVAFSGSYNDLSDKPTIPSVTGKADKVSGATSGNFAGLDSNGNLTDSGHKHSDYLTSHQSLAACYQTGDTAETTLSDSDKFPFYDASASGKRQSTWSNIKSKLKSYFDGYYTALSTVPTGGSSGQVLMKNSSTNYDTKWGTVSGGTTDSALSTSSTNPVQNKVLGKIFSIAEGEISTSHPKISSSYQMGCSKSDEEWYEDSVFYYLDSSFNIDVSQTGGAFSFEIENISMGAQNLKQAKFLTNCSASLASSGGSTNDCNCHSQIVMGSQYAQSIKVIFEAGYVYTQGGMAWSQETLNIFVKMPKL